MKTPIALAILAILAGQCRAEPPRSLAIDWQQTTAPALTVYQANSRTFTVTMRSGATPINLTGYTPRMWWALSNTAPSYVGATCTVLVATSGTFTATWTASDLNHAQGNFVYGVGLTSNTYTTAQMGTLTIRSDPYAASGAAPITWASNVINGSSYTFTAPWPTSAIPASIVSGAAAGATAIQAESDTLATVLSRGNNAAGSITNVSSLQIGSGQFHNPMTVTNYDSRLLIYGDLSGGTSLTVGGPAITLHAGAGQDNVVEFVPEPFYSIREVFMKNNGDWNFGDHSISAVSNLTARNFIGNGSGLTNLSFTSLPGETATVTNFASMVFSNGLLISHTP